MLKAVTLLRDPNAKIINVAEECGFNHLGLFNASFKRRFGASPGQWRDQGNDLAQGPADCKANRQVCAVRIAGHCPMDDAETPKQ